MKLYLLRNFLALFKTAPLASVLIPALIMPSPIISASAGKRVSLQENLTTDVIKAKNIHKEAARPDNPASFQQLRLFLKNGGILDIVIDKELSIKVDEGYLEILSEDFLFSTEIENVRKWIFPNIRINPESVTNNEDLSEYNISSEMMAGILTPQDEEVGIINWQRNGDFIRIINAPAPAAIYLNDLSGTQMFAAEGMKEGEIDLSPLRKGIYVLSINSQSFKILKK